MMDENEPIQFCMECGYENINPREGDKTDRIKANKCMSNCSTEQFTNTLRKYKKTLMMRYFISRKQLKTYPEWLIERDK